MLLSQHFLNDAVLTDPFVPSLHPSKFPILAGRLVTEPSKKKKPKKKPKTTKEAQLVIRLDVELRDKFIAACQDVDTSASREMRRFMKQFLKQYERGELDD